MTENIVVSETGYNYSSFICFVNNTLHTFENLINLESEFYSQQKTYASTLTRNLVKSCESNTFTKISSLNKYNKRNEWSSK